MDKNNNDETSGNVLNKLRDLMGHLMKLRRINRFEIGDRILFYDQQEGAWDEGEVVSPRVGNNYDIRGVDGRRRLFNGRELKPLKKEKGDS